MTELERDAARVGDMLKRPGLPRLANPFKLWVLDPPRAPGPSAQLDRESK